MSNLAQQETFTFSIQALQYGNKKDDMPSNPFQTSSNLHRYTKRECISTKQDKTHIYKLIAL